jgi:hypothetical protein
VAQREGRVVRGGELSLVAGCLRFDCRVFGREGHNAGNSRREDFVSRVGTVASASIGADITEYGSTPGPLLCV